MTNIADFLKSAKRQLSSWSADLHSIESHISDLSDQGREKLNRQLKILKADWKAFEAKAEAWDARIEAKLGDGWDEAEIAWKEGRQSLEQDWDRFSKAVAKAKADFQKEVA